MGWENVENKEWQSIHAQDLLGVLDKAAVQFRETVVKTIDIQLRHDDDTVVVLEGKKRV